MAMLAERRRKTKYVLYPGKRPIWSDESSGMAFGKKLMEKFGWNAGKGLGSNEQGIQEPIRVSFKHDNKGMGFKGNDDDWIQHQDEFNNLLAGLSQGSKVPASNVESLEEKSKNSRSRLHYKKFTRGKDLSKYSQKDMACIFGIKEKKPKEVNIVEECAPVEDNQETTSFGVTTLLGGSINDYFKNKFKENGLKLKNQVFDRYKADSDEDEPSYTGFGFHKKEQESQDKQSDDSESNTNDQMKKIKYENFAEETTNRKSVCFNLSLNTTKEITSEESFNSSNTDNEELKVKKKKIKIKKIHLEEESEENGKCEDFSVINNEQNEIESVIGNTQKEDVSKKKSKKRKKKMEEDQEPKCGTETSMDIINEKRNEGIIDEKVKKKRKKQSNNTLDTIEEETVTTNRKKKKIEEIEEQKIESENFKQKSKKKEKEHKNEETIETVTVNMEQMCIEVIEEIAMERSRKKRKERKNKKNLETGEESKNDDIIEDIVTKKSKKKRKKDKYLTERSENDAIKEKVADNKERAEDLGEEKSDTSIIANTENTLSKKFKKKNETEEIVDSTLSENIDETSKKLKCKKRKHESKEVTNHIIDNSESRNEEKVLAPSRDNYTPPGKLKRIQLFSQVKVDKFVGSNFKLLQGYGNKGNTNVVHVKPCKEC